MNMPVSVVLAGLLLIVSFAMSYSERGQTGWSRFYYGYRFVCLLLCKFIRKLVMEAEKLCRDHFGKKAPLCVLVDASLYLTLRHDYNHTSFMCNASHTVGLMSSLWKPNHSIMILPRPIETFRQRHASILQQITTVSCMDLLCGE